MGLQAAREKSVPRGALHVSQRSDFQIVQLNYHTPVNTN